MDSIRNGSGSSVKLNYFNVKRGLVGRRKIIKLFYEIIVLSGTSMCVFKTWRNESIDPVHNRRHLRIYYKTYPLNTYKCTWTKVSLSLFNSCYNLSHTKTLHLPQGGHFENHLIQCQEIAYPVDPYPLPLFMSNPSLSSSSWHVPLNMCPKTPNCSHDGCL